MNFDGQAPKNGASFGSQSPKSPASPSGSQGSIRAQLRGMNYADGASLLSPDKPVDPKVGLDQIKKSTTHRGRLQIQGGGLERSWPWTRDAPPPAIEAAAGLATIWSTLTPREQKTRDQAYSKANKYILNAAPEGVDAPISLSFQNANLKPAERDHRIDIEVIKGRAFVGSDKGSHQSATHEVSVKEAHEERGGKSGGGGASSSW